MHLSPKENEKLALEEFKKGILNVSSTPRMLTIESTSRCNLRCVMCPHVIGAVDRPKDIDQSLVDKLGVFLPKATSVQLHGIGEPLVSPAFWDLLENLPKPEVCASSVNTNFTLLNKKKLDTLVNSNLNLINISLDAAKTSTYKKIRNADLDEVINNIKLLSKEKIKRGTKYPYIYLNMTLMRSNIEEVVDFICLAKKLNTDKVVLWHLNHWSEEEMSRYIIDRNNWVFDYKKEGLWNYPDLSNKMIAKAEDKAKELGISLYNPDNLYFKNGVNNAKS